MLYRIIPLILFLLNSNYIYATNHTFDNIVKTQLQQKLNIDDIDIDISFTPHRKYTNIINNTHKINSISISNISGQLFTVKIIYKNNKHKFINGIYNNFINIPIANKNITPGSIILQQDISTKRIALNKINKNIHTSRSNIVGMEAKSYINCNSMFSKQSMNKPIAINKNDIVNVVHNAKNLKLKNTAIALTNGAISEIIKFKTPDLKKTLIGKILDNKTIEIK